MTKFPTIRPAAGFTLVEVMMAATMLVVGFVGLIQAVAVTSLMMDTARRQTLADQIMQHEIEELRLASWATISALPATSTVIAIDPQFTAAVSASGATYTLTRTFTSPDPDVDLREANFTVTWVVLTSRHGTSGALLTFTYTRKNSAYYGKYGLNLTYQRS